MYMRLISLFVFLLLLRSTAPIAAQAVQSVCGQPVSGVFEGSFWGRTTQSGETQIAIGSVDTANLTLRNAGRIPTPLEWTGFLSDITTLDAGQTVALLAQATDATRFDDEKTLIILTLDGHQITLPDDVKPSDLHWWQLLPERAPGQFGIFGFTSGVQAFLMDVAWSGAEISLGEPQFLPFEFSPGNYYWRMLTISPDAAYIGYAEHDRQVRRTEYFIYAVKEERFIWQSIYDGDGFVSVLWLSTPETFALVSGTTAETHSQLLRVSPAGESDVLLDLAAIYGEDAVISPLSQIVISPTQAAFWVITPDTDRTTTSRLVMFDATHNELIDLCFERSQTPVPLGVIGDKLVFRLAENPSQVAIISAASGDYSIIDLGGFQPISEAIEAVPNSGSDSTP